MLKLNFTKKSALLAFITLLAFSVITINLYSHLHQDIDRAQQELVGLKLIKPLFNVIELIQVHRGLYAGILSGTESLNTERIKIQNSTSVAFKKFATQMRSQQDIFTAWQPLKQQWAIITVEGKTWSKQQNFSKHTLLINQIFTLIQTIADTYYLTNNPKLSVYYLFHTALHQLTPAQELLGQVRAFTVSILPKKRSSKFQRIVLHTLLNESDAKIELLHIDLEKTAKYNPAIAVELLAASVNIINNSKKINSLVTQNIMQEKYILTPEEFFSSATKTINNSYQTLHNILLPATKKIITQFIHSTQKTLFISLSCIIIVIILLFYVAMAIYLATTKNINKLSLVTVDFAKGNLNKRIPLDFESELKPLAESFNFMADKLTTLITHEKKDKARIKAIIDSSQDALIRMNCKGEIIEWNTQAEHVLGWRCHEILGKKLFSVIIPSHFQKQYFDEINQHEQTILNTTHEIMAKHHDNYEFPIEFTLTSINVDDQCEYNAFIRDISERKQAEAKLHLAAQVFVTTREGIMITDNKHLIIEVNNAFCDITGYDRQDIIGHNPSILRSSQQPPMFYKTMWKTLNTQGFWRGEVWNRKKNGELYAELLSISVIKDKQGNIVNCIGLFSDITSQKQQQDKLNLMAYYDVLTKLPNRALFADRFNQAIAHSKRSNTILGICFLDLDSFKPINDDFGHDIGDIMLVEVAGRIKACIREEDTVSRQGGDEFTILLGNLHSIEQCKQTLERIRNSLARPFIINKSAHKITASIGVTLYPSDNNELEILLKHADNAMYQAKLAGKNRYQFFGS